MDYQDLLKKYIRYVGEVEGTDFIEHGCKSYSGDQEFTPDEWNALALMSNEILAENLRHSNA